MEARQEKKGEKKKYHPPKLYLYGKFSKITMVEPTDTSGTGKKGAHFT